LQPRARSLSLDEARLRPHLRRQPARSTPGVWTPADVLDAAAEEALRQRDLAAVPSPGDMRGVPIVNGCAGVMPGTDPVAALMRKER
jgi:hypothetical protein